MKEIKTRLNQAGQSVIELLLATMIVGVVVTAMAVGLTYTIKNNAEARYRQVSIDLGQEAVEFFRQEKDRLGWPNFAGALTGANQIFCLQSIPATLDDLPDAGACATGVGISLAGTDFVREAAVVVNEAQTEVRVDVTISWFKDADSDRTNVVSQTFKKPF